MVSSTHIQRGGFALLMTLLVVSVVIPVTLVILDVTTKQVRLAGNARDSEVAFHAASAGLECAQRLRGDAALETLFENTYPNTPTTIASANCFFISANPPTLEYRPFANPPTDGRVNHFVTQFTWGSAPQERCTRIDMLVMISDVDDPTDVQDSHIRAVIPTYPRKQVQITTCPPGGVCTLISSRGYNRSCPADFDDELPSGSTQREVLLEY